MPDKITKFILSLDKKTRSRLIKKIEMILKDPYAVAGVKKLQGHEDLFRCRIGDIRIIYAIRNDEVEIRDIDYRGNIY